MENLVYTLQNLGGFYGYATVHAKLLEIMKKEYEDLKKVFENTSKSKGEEPKEKKQEKKQTPVEEPVDQERSLMSMRDKKIKILKKDTVEQPSEEHTQDTLAAKTAKEAKQNQKDLEVKKRQELEASGVVPESLLTEENLRKWIVTEKRTFAYIARMYVGCPEAQVATVAKSFQIESEISKKRAEIIRGKKGRA